VHQGRSLPYPPWARLSEIRMRLLHQSFRRPVGERQTLALRFSPFSLVLISPGFLSTSLLSLSFGLAKVLPLLSSPHVHDHRNERTPELKRLPPRFSIPLLLNFRVFFLLIPLFPSCVELLKGTLFSRIMASFFLFSSILTKEGASIHRLCFE